jgi:hypothetical protein
MSNSQSEALDKLEQYKTAFHLIADQVQQQIALEEHQRKKGLPFDSIEFGRADVYQKIALITMKTLGQPPELFLQGSVRAEYTRQ